MIFGEACEIEVGKDIAQQNQAAKGMLRQQYACIVGAAQLRPEVEIGKDERVVADRTHQLSLY